MLYYPICNNRLCENKEACRDLKRLYLTLARLLPLKYRNSVKQLSIYAGQSLDVDIYLGLATTLGLSFAIISLLIPFAFAQDFTALFAAVAVGVFVFIELIAYLSVYFKAEDRTKRVEEALPDALQLVAANVRAGMTPYKALKLAARKEFGPLSEEINHVTSRAMGTESFADLLLEMSKRIRSETLERAMEMFTTAMRSGGRLAVLLEELAKDIDETRSLKRDLMTSTKTYISFIMFTIILGAPMLLSISIQFITVITSMQAKAGVSDAGFGLSMLAGEITITADFLTKLSIAMLIMTSLLASMLLGTIKEGKPKYGFRYAPIIIVGSLIAFVVFRHFVANFFGSMM